MRIKHLKHENALQTDFQVGSSYPWTDKGCSTPKHMFQLDTMLQRLELLLTPDANLTLHLSFPFEYIFLWNTTFWNALVMKI